MTSRLYFLFLRNPGGEDLSRSVLPLDFTPPTASLPVSQSYMAKCEEHHHSQPQEIPQSKPHHLPKQKQHPKHTPLNDSQKLLLSTSLPQTQNPKKRPPDIDPYPKFNQAYLTTPQTKHQTKPQSTLQPKSQISVQPVNQLPSDPNPLTDPHLRFQPTLKPFQSHNLIPEQPHLQPTPNLILQTSQQTQTLQPNIPTNSERKIIFQTTPSNNIQQSISPKVQAQPRMLKPPSLSTAKSILQTQSEDQKRSKPKHQNELHPELQSWTQQQFNTFPTEAQPQQATESIFQTLKQTKFLPTTETQTQHWPRSQKKPQKETQSNKPFLPKSQNKKQPQTANKLIVQTEKSLQITLSPIASSEHQHPTFEPFVHTQQQIKPVTQPTTIAPLPIKTTSQNPLQNREKLQTKPPIQFQFTSEPKAQAKKQNQARLQPKPQTKRPKPHKPSILKTQKKPYPQVPTSQHRPQPTIKPIFHIKPPPQSTIFSNIQNNPYPESQPTYLPKSHPQQYPQSQPTSKSIHVTQSQLQQTVKFNLQTEIFPHSQPESQFRHQPQQPQSTLNSLLETQEISQPTTFAKHQNEPTSYQQSQKTFQVQTHLYPSQTHSTVMPILGTQPKVETKVQDMSKLQQPNSEPIFHPQPPLQPKVQMQPSQQSQLWPEKPQTQTSPNSASLVVPKNGIYPKTQPPFQAIPNPQKHIKTNSQTVPHPIPQSESHPQSKPVLQNKSELHKPQHKPTAIPPFQIQSEATSHLQSYNELYTESHPTYQAKHYSEKYPQLQPLSQPQATSKVKLKNERYPLSQTESQFNQDPKPTSNSFFESKSIPPTKYQNEPYPQSHRTFQTQPHLYQSQPQPSLKPIVHTKPQVQPTVQELQPKLPPKPHKEPSSQPQPTVHTEQPQSHSTSQSTAKTESYRKAQTSSQIETQTKKLEPTKTKPPNPWNEFHSPPQPTNQVIGISHHEQQFQPTMKAIVQTEPYKQSQPSPQQPQINYTSIPIHQKQTTTKSPSTFHIQSHNKPYLESQPLVQTTLYLQQEPQPKSTLNPTLQPDLLPTQSTSEQSISTSRPMHQTKIPTQAASQSTQKNEPPPQLKQTFQDKPPPKHQHYQPTFNPTFQTQSQKILPPLLNIYPLTTPNHQSKPENVAQPQHTQLFHLEEHTQKKPQPSATLHDIIQRKPQQKPTHQTQTPLKPYSQTQHSPYQLTLKPSWTKHTPIFQTQTRSTPHPLLQMQSQTPPGNQPILQTQLQESIPQPTRHHQPETKQPSLSHPTSQSLHQHKPPQTIQPTNHIPNQQAFQPTHKNLLETQSKSEPNLQKELQPHKHSEPQISKPPQKKTNGKTPKKPRPKPKFHHRPTTKSQPPTEMQQPKPTPIFQKKPLSQSQPASQHHSWIQEQQKMQSTSKPLLQTQQQKQKFVFQNQTYTTLQPKVWITPALQHIPKTLLQPASKHKTESKPKPQPNLHTLQRQTEPTFSPKLQQQSKPTFQPIGQTQSKFPKIRPKPWRRIKQIKKSTTPQPVSQIHTQTPSHSKTKMTMEAEKKLTLQPNIHSHTTVQSQPILQKPTTSQSIPESQSFSQPQLRPTPMQATSQPLPQTQPQLQPTGQSIPEAQSLSQSQPRPTPMQGTSQLIPQTQPQLKTTSQSIPEPQSLSQSQPRSTTTTKTQTTSKPKLQTHQSQHKLTPHSKVHVEETMVSIQAQTHESAERTSHPITDSQSISLQYLSSKSHFQPETLLKQQTTTWPQVQPDPRLQTESQTRTYTDPTKITPGQTLFMGKDPTFDLSNPQKTL